MGSKAGEKRGGIGVIIKRGNGSFFFFFLCDNCWRMKVSANLGNDHMSL